MLVAPETRPRSRSGMDVHAEDQFAKGSASAECDGSRGYGARFIVSGGGDFPTCVSYLPAGPSPNDASPEQTYGARWGPSLRPVSPCRRELKHTHRRATHADGALTTNTSVPVPAPVPAPVPVPVRSVPVRPDGGQPLIEAAAARSRRNARRRPEGQGTYFYLFSVKDVEPVGARAHLPVSGKSSASSRDLASSFQV